MKRLPLDAVEAFALSQVDGRLALGDVAEIVGMDLEKLLALARRLLELGALTGPPGVVRPAEADPPKTSGVYAHRVAREDPPEEPAREPRKHTPKESRRSSRSMRAAKPVVPSEPKIASPEGEACDLDEATLADITALDAALATRDYYALLGIERQADDRAIKRAYFGMAAKYHPDRFYGKKLGRARALLTRIFGKLTEAHDALLNGPLRAVYDATLAPLKPSDEPPRRLSKSLRRPSKTKIIIAEVAAAAEAASTPQSPPLTPQPAASSPPPTAPATAPQGTLRPSAAPASPGISAPPPRSVSPASPPGQVAAKSSIASVAPEPGPSAPPPSVGAAQRISVVNPVVPPLAPPPASLRPDPTTSTRMGVLPPSGPPPSIPSASLRPDPTTATKMGVLPASGSPGSMPPAAMRPASMPPAAVRPTSMAPTSMPPTQMPPASMPSPSVPPASGSPSLRPSFQTRAALENAKRRAHMETFLRAAEEALKVEDYIGAANNYQLALQVDEDPAIRAKLASIEGQAKAKRREKALARARVAEREQKWSDAALYFSQAHDASPDASLAERAAYAIRMSEGDLRRAGSLAEFAVAQDPKNAAYRVTLGEIYHAANLPKRALAESTRALELAPNDPRARELAVAIKKKK